MTWQIRKQQMQQIAQEIQTKSLANLCEQIKDMNPEFQNMSQDVLMKRMQHGIHEAKSKGYTDPHQAAIYAISQLDPTHHPPMDPDYSWLAALTKPPFTLAEQMQSNPLLNDQRFSVIDRVLDRIAKPFGVHPGNKIAIKLKPQLWFGMVLEIAFELCNHHDHSIYVFYASDENGTPQTQFHYTFWQDPETLHLTKRFWPVSDIPSAQQTPPMLMEIQPGETLTDTLYLALPIGLRCPEGQWKTLKLTPMEQNLHVGQYIGISFGYITNRELLTPTGRSIPKPGSRSIRERHNLFNIGFDDALLYQHIASTQPVDHLLIAQRYLMAA